MSNLTGVGRDKATLYYVDAVHCFAPLRVCVMLCTSNERVGSWPTLLIVDFVVRTFRTKIQHNSF
jgi:hypothetical protein